MRSPCETCTRVADPTQCENKKCGPWIRWFTGTWDDTCKLFTQPREDRRIDPCMQCSCPSRACSLPCARKRDWQIEEGEVYELEG